VDLISILVWLATVFSGGGDESTIERADCARPTSPAEQRVCDIR
jgi:hypothetical protein